jgi:cobaltochelatase CobS
MKMPANSSGSLKGLYDSDVIAAIVKEEESTQGAKISSTDPYEITKKYKFKDKWATGVMFSDMFWTPTTIQDVPLPMFEATDWDPEAQIHIPSDDPNWVWNKPVTERFALAMYCDDTTLLHGLPGTGKSCLPEQWCAMFNIPFWRMSCNSETREGHFLGSPQVDYNSEGQMSIQQAPTTLTDSLKYGGIFCEDEAFRHSSALVLQSLREKNTRYVIQPDAPGRTAVERKLIAPKDKWWYVLTDNTNGIGDETGAFDAEVQDASTLDRVGATIKVDYLKPKDEAKIIKNHSTLNKKTIDSMISFANLVRDSFGNRTLMSTFSVRSLLAWAEKAEMTGNLELGLTLAWLDKLSDEDTATAKEMYHQVFERLIK